MGVGAVGEELRLQVKLMGGHKAIGKAPTLDRRARAGFPEQGAPRSWVSKGKLQFATHPPTPNFQTHTSSGGENPPLPKG